jgi:hypothetical protein
MSKFDMKEEAVVVPEPVKPVTVVASGKPPSTAKEVLKFKDTSPANWVISIALGGNVTAYNTQSGETFNGTPADFNAALRG